MSDAKPQPAPKTPAERYSWVSASSQSSQSIIERTDSPASPSFSRTNAAQSGEGYFDQPSGSASSGEVPPPIPRRSSYNYAHDAEEFSKARPEDRGESAVSDQLHEGSFKPQARGRTKSWDYQDMKRHMHSGLMMTAAVPEGENQEGYGFTEK